MFQSTHPRRVRRRTEQVYSKMIGFNPRTHVGCDLFCVFSCKIFGCFNPRTHVGCDD